MSDLRPFPPSDRTRVRRVPERGNYDLATIAAIVDEALVCHVGFVSDDKPYVIPMAIARDGDRLLLHGSTASRLMRVLAQGAEVCVTVTHLDGVVVARSAFHSSMNYRSAVIVGRAESITDPEEKREALRLLVERLIPGRWEEVRASTDQELRATTILAVPMNEASAKIRSGPPVDDEADLGLDTWAGEIPLRTTRLDPVPDPLVGPEIETPPSVLGFDRMPRLGPTGR
jgi:nitroimidazol reductase NimA-like FMN-containing flavoprotein (pyridoxamine 5'-phosphate oxidase superfamily)